MHSTNKKAQIGSQIVFFAFLFILVVIATGIVIGVFIFFGKEYDFRKLDSQILNRNLQKCFSQNKINFQLANEELAKEIFEKCKLNQKVLEENYFIQINVNGEKKLNFKDANKCFFGNQNPEYPICVNSSIIFENKEIFILSGTDQSPEIKT